MEFMAKTQGSSPAVAEWEDESSGEVGRGSGVGTVWVDVEVERSFLRPAGGACEEISGGA